MKMILWLPLAFVAVVGGASGQTPTVTQTQTPDQSICGTVFTSCPAKS